MEAINFTLEALVDLEYWKKSDNIIILKRIRQLLQDIQTDPFNGIGKPEALKYLVNQPICNLCFQSRLRASYYFTGTKYERTLESN